MRGELIGVWTESFPAIWSRLAKHPAAPKDLFIELYRELVAALTSPPNAQSLADMTANESRARSAFRRTKSIAFEGEAPLVMFFESAHSVLYDLGGDDLANRYFLLTESFIELFSLRYDLRRPFTLSPNISGLFSSLTQDLRQATLQDVHLHSMMNDFESSVRDLKDGCTDTRIKTCIQKQMNLLEALGQKYPGVTQNTLGDICEQLNSWPHPAVRLAMKNLYGFASNYPGIRHAGTPGGVLRAIDMRDMVALSIVLAGFAPYLTDRLDPQLVYLRS